MKTSPTEKCCKCGRYVGITFAGYQKDRLSDRGGLWCEPCLIKYDLPTPSADDQKGMPEKEIAAMLGSGRYIPTAEATHNAG